MKNQEWLGKEIYRVERSKIFGHLRPYLSYVVLLLLVYTGWYRGDIVGISISLIIFLALIMLFTEQTFRRIIFYENGFVISNYFTRVFKYDELKLIYLQFSSGLFFKENAPLIINFGFKKLWIEGLIFDINTSLIQKNEIERIIEIFKLKEVHYDDSAKAGI